MSEELKQNLDVLAKVLGCVAVWLAYLKYRHSVEIAKKNGRRAAVELAAKECTHFGRNLLPMVSELQEQISASGCEYSKHCKIVKNENGLAVNTNEVTEEDRQKIQMHIKKIVEVLNALEGFAIPFSEGVADDRVGFVECGRAFVQAIENLAPLYYFCPLSDYYKSSQAVYTRWRNQIQREEENRKIERASKEFVVMSAQLLKHRTKSRFWQFVANWCLERAKD